MNESGKSGYENLIDRFLASGEQSAITDGMAVLVEHLKELDVAGKIKGIFSILRKLKHKKSDVKEKWARAADQIIVDGYTTGCSDVALVFVTLCRAVGLPAKIIDTADNDWIDKPNLNRLPGHAYAGFFDGEQWVIVDPSERISGVDIEKDKRTITKEGLDFWDMGIRNFDDMKRTFLEIINKKPV